MTRTIKQANASACNRNYGTANATQLWLCIQRCKVRTIRVHRAAVVSSDTLSALECWWFHTHHTTTIIFTTKYWKTLLKHATQLFVVVCCWCCVQNGAQWSMNVTCEHKQAVWWLCVACVQQAQPWNERTLRDAVYWVYWVELTSKHCIVQNTAITVAAVTQAPVSCVPLGQPCVQGSVGLDWTAVHY